MPRTKQVESKRGKGKCGSPNCDTPKAEGHFLCSHHVTKISKIKEEIEIELLPRSLFMRKSADSEKMISVKGPRTPTCCALGCYQSRIPPNSYCIDHIELETNE